MDKVKISSVRKPPIKILERMILTAFQALKLFLEKIRNSAKHRIMKGITTEATTITIIRIINSAVEDLAHQRMEPMTKMSNTSSSSNDRNKHVAATKSEVMVTSDLQERTTVVTETTKSQDLHANSSNVAMIPTKALPTPEVMKRGRKEAVAAVAMAVEEIGAVANEVTVVTVIATIEVPVKIVSQESQESHVNLVNLVTMSKRANAKTSSLEEVKAKVKAKSLANLSMANSRSEAGH